MRVDSFEDIVAWEKAKRLSVDLYIQFRPLHDQPFKNQLQRAGVSVMNNIAAGFERQSNKDFKHFLYISKGSCGEVRSMLHLAHDLHYLDTPVYERMVKQATEISRMLSGFIKQL